MVWRQTGRWYVLITETYIYKKRPIKEIYERDKDEAHAFADGAAANRALVCADKRDLYLQKETYKRDL